MSANLIKSIRRSLGNEALEQRISELERKIDIQWEAIIDPAIPQRLNELEGRLEALEKQAMLTLARELDLVPKKRTKKDKSQPSE